MKRVLTVFLLVILTRISDAQPYGNEWIPFSAPNPYSLQQYFKIQVWKEGIYRVTYADMLGVNMPLSTINPKKMQLFFAGVEQYIFISKDTTAWDNTMYLEFYGRRNDGRFDASLYITDTFQVNTGLSLFNDTAAYFLTWNNFGADGKRMIEETDVNFAAYPLTSYVTRRTYLDFGATSFHEGYRDANGLTDNEYISGETWTSTEFYNNGPVPGQLTRHFPTRHVYPAGPPARLETVVLGANNNGSIPAHLFSMSLNGTAIGNDFLNEYDWRRYLFTMSPSVLAPDSSAFVCTALPTGTGPNMLRIAYITLSYPHAMDFTGDTGPQVFSVEGNNALGKANLKFSNTSLGPGSPVLYAINGDVIRRVTVVAGSEQQMLVPATLEQHCILTTEGLAFTNVIDFRFQPITTNPNYFAQFINYNYQGPYDYVMISHASLMTEAIPYKAYRSSIPGGSHQVLLADIQELFDQFAYGINGHPLSIRNLCRYLIASQATPPGNLFLLGKSISLPTVRGHSTPWELVPTIGYPASDNLFTTRLTDSTSSSWAIPTGRLAAKNPDEVKLYLDKIIDYESQPGADWMKQVLHFSGGSSLSEELDFFTILEGYRAIIEDTLFGGHVTTYRKSSSNPISNISSLELKNLINNGVSYMTFFGHAAGSSFDVTTDLPSTYQNYGKYPIVIANSCYIGNIHTDQVSGSEDFVLQDNKGAIAFIADPFKAYAGFLAAYSDQLYRNISNYNYGNSIALSMKKSTDSILVYDQSNFYSRTTCIGMTLHGDPALVPNSFTAPDLEITQASVFTNPAIVTSEYDTFQLIIVIRNKGKATGMPFHVMVSRTYPDQTDTVVISQSSYIAYEDTLTFSMKTGLQHGNGFNNFSVKVDFYNQLAESNEFNNTATYTMEVQSSDVIPVYPYRFAIVPDPQLTLKATTSNPFAPLSSYRFEIDTTDQFLNPLLQFDTMQTGGVVRWHLPFTLDTNKVYYWRVADKKVLTDTVHHRWNESSFIHLPGKSGWSQAHFFQFKNNDRNKILYNRPSRSFDFITTQSTLVARNTLYPLMAGHNGLEYFVDNQLRDYYPFEEFTHALHIAVLDSISLESWETRFVTTTGDTLNPDHFYNNINDNGAGGRLRPDKYFVFRADSQQLIHANNMISQVPAGNYILIYSAYAADYSVWPAGFMQTILGLGSDSANLVQDYQPWIFFCQKGNPGTAVEVFGDSLNPDISLTAYMGGNWSKGSMASEIIGPANKWTSLHWAQHPKEGTVSTRDSVMLTLTGITGNGVATTVIPQIPPASTTIYNLDQLVDANQYPFLRFSVYLQDDSLKSPPQLDRWQIYYEGVPEAAINPSAYFTFYSNPLQHGDTAKLAVALENISNLDFPDSILVDHYLYDQNHIRNNLGLSRAKKLKAGETDTLRISFGTLDKLNNNTLWVEANPNNDQPEQYHFNNFAQINFDVARDITNPVLDVTFDGVHILNGDIISSKPYIIMQLTDENKFLALNDTSHWRVFLKEPQGSSRQLYFENTAGYTGDRAKMKWTPAQMPKNSFKIEYNPEFFQDGLYELIVDASSDVSGNESGKNSYRITFEVINHSSITSVVNYPNPFSSSTRFVFTLTGSEVPDYFKIQIMTISGKIVREIMREELGTIRIGRNITEYAWNGRDEFGDQLANGIYLYRVLTSIKGSSIEKRGTEADKFFKKGYGKMYLMR